MNKQIKSAIEERLTMFWRFGPLNDEQVLSRYELRTITGHSEQGTQFSRRLYSTMSEVSAVKLHREILEEGVPEYAKWGQAPLGVPALVGNPTKAREDERWRRSP